MAKNFDELITIKNDVMMFHKYFLSLIPNFSFSTTWDADLVRSKFSTLYHCALSCFGGDSGGTNESAFYNIIDTDLDYSELSVESRLIILLASYSMCDLTTIFFSQMLTHFNS